MPSKREGDDEVCGSDLVCANNNCADVVNCQTSIKALEDEEARLRREAKKKQSEERAIAIKHWESEQKELRYRRLQILLQKSKVYANFLLKRIEQQAVDAQKLENRKAGRKQKEISDSSSQESTDLPAKGNRKKRKCTKVRLEDYLDRSVLKAIQDQEPASKRPKLEKKTFEFNCTYFTGGTLRDYQIEGVDWMLNHYENGMNGILADEMGLGKTVQIIGLLSKLMENGVPGPFLIVGPLSTIPNWLSEFKRFSPTINTLLFHGSMEERRVLAKKELYRATVIITSYEMCNIEIRALSGLRYRYIIVDEGHRLKNMNCLLIRTLKSFYSVNRLLLTGTPLQNNLAELWSLLNFLLPDVFDDLTSFETWFDFSMVMTADSANEIIEQEKENQILSMLHEILSPFLLRRVKSDVELNLPPKKEMLVYAHLTSAQQALYSAAIDNTIRSFLIPNLKTAPLEEDKENQPRRKRKSALRASRVNSAVAKAMNKSNVSEEQIRDIWTQELKKSLDEANEEALKKKANNDCGMFCVNLRLQNKMMQLRKIVNHPYLIQFPIKDKATGELLLDDGLATTSGKMQLLGQMLPELTRRGHKMLIFSQMTKMLDIIADFLFIKEWNYRMLTGSMNLADRQQSIEEFNTDEDVKIFLASTRAGGLGINLTAADTVIIYDSDWNPQCDLQAQDRCHRIGQTRPVIVYRLVTADTIDQKIVDRATAKRKLEKMVMKDGKFKGRKEDLCQPKSITETELQNLLSSVHHQGTFEKSEEILSKSQLDSLLDRSEMAAKSEIKGLYRVVEEVGSSFSVNRK